MTYPPPFSLQEPPLRTLSTKDSHILKRKFGQKRAILTIIYCRFARKLNVFHAYMDPLVWVE